MPVMKITRIISWIAFVFGMIAIVNVLLAD